MVRFGISSIAFYYALSLPDSDAEPSSPDDNRVPLSLKYHLADIYLEVLDKVLAYDPETCSERPPRAPLDTLIAPFLTLLALTPSNHTFDRVMSTVLEPLIQSLAADGTAEPPSKKRRRLLGNEISFVADNSCISSDSSAADKSSLHQALLKQVFSVASEQDTRDSNRRRLYKFWKSNVEDRNDDALHIAMVEMRIKLPDPEDQFRLRHRHAPRVGRPGRRPLPVESAKAGPGRQG